LFFISLSGYRNAFIHISVSVAYLAYKRTVFVCRQAPSFFSHKKTRVSMLFTIYDVNDGNQLLSGVPEGVVQGFIENEMNGSFADVRVEDQNGAEPHWSLTPRQKAEREADRIKRLSRQHQHRPR
jgi:hypothetical protein